MKGDIDGKTFLLKSGIKIVTTVIATVSGVAGAAIGGMIGTAIWPGIGTIIGAIVGSILTGGFVGYITEKFLESRFIKAIEIQKLEGPTTD